MKTPSAALTSEVISLRQAIFLATGTSLTATGIWLIWQRFSPNGITRLEGTLIAIFAILFTQLAFGFSIAWWGFITALRGGDRYQILQDLPEAETAGGAISSTAVVMPVFNEEVGRVFAGLEAMVRSVEATQQGKAFDFYILSDSNQPDHWIEEESAWLDLCTRLAGFGRIFYRKRRVSLHGKSGNIADFCRRWGRRYRYMLILDADSIMSGKTLVQLARAMDANPNVGIIQTAPKLVRGNSVWQRLMQFSTSVVGPIFTIGSHFWHLAGGNYWGHNAIIRLQPFMEHCVLPELPVKRRDDRHIMSHDTIEAALMQQAGYQVWLAAGDTGSYEEGPPNLTESLKRDRRWCQGNLQHFWFLFAPETRFSNRIHIFFGLMSYLTSPLLVVSIILSCVDYYWADRYALMSSQPDDPAWSGGSWATMDLLWLTLVLLFLPKILGLIISLPKAKNFGGAFRLCLGSLLDNLLSVLVAPVMLYFYCKFVVMILLGIKVVWKTQNRADSRITFGDALGEYWQPTLLGILGTAAGFWWVSDLLPWLSPILVGLLLAIPTAMFTASEAAGLWLRKWGLFLSPDETHPPMEIATVDAAVAPAEPYAAKAPESHGGLIEVFLSPRVNAMHLSLLRRSRSKARHKEDYLAKLRQTMLQAGPHALTRRETMAVLWDADSVSALHQELWTANLAALHPAWRHAMQQG